MPSITLYYNPVCPHARAALIVAKQLGLDVTIKQTEFGPNGTRSAEYLKLNPTHTVPTLVDGDYVLIESRAIIKYLASKYDPKGTFYPADPQARGNVDKIIFFDVTGYFPSLRPVFFAKRQGKELTTEQTDELKEKIQILATLLGEHKFFAGDHPTLADVSVGVTFPYIAKYAPEYANEKLDAWYKRASEAIPALKQVNDEGAAAAEAHAKGH